MEVKETREFPTEEKADAFARRLKRYCIVECDIEKDVWRVHWKRELPKDWKEDCGVPHLGEE